MRKMLVLIVAVGLTVSGFMVAGFARADDFEVLWAIDLPRETYFIGETVTFTVIAFTSGETSIFIPGEMALVTIRNSSLAECYAGWITTNQNGSSPISWVVPLESLSDNYTIILQPIVGATLTKSFVTLYDEATYWMKRVEQVEDEINQQYGYLNYLFSRDKYYERQVKILKDRVIIMGFVMFITIMATIVTVVPEWARRSNNYHPKSMSSKLAKVMGFSNTPKVLLTDQHDELAQLKTPEGKKPPRYGLDYTCQFCDPDKHEPMTKAQYEEHIMSHYRRLWNLGARRRNTVYKQLVNERYEIKEARPPHEKLIEAEKKRDEIIDSIELSRKELRAIASEKKNLEAEALAEKKRIEKEKKKAAKAMKKAKTAKKKKSKPVVKPSPISIPESQRKARRIKPLSASLEPPPPPPEILELEDDAVRPSNPSTHRTAIDDLFEQLMNEKVN